MEIEIERWINSKGEERFDLTGLIKGEGITMSRSALEVLCIAVQEALNKERP